MRISDWSSDVCSSDLDGIPPDGTRPHRTCQDDIICHEAGRSSPLSRCGQRGVTIAFSLCASAIGGDITFSYISSKRSSGIRRSSGSPDDAAALHERLAGGKPQYITVTVIVAVSVRRYVLTCGNAPVNQSKLRTQICLIEEKSRKLSDSRKLLTSLLAAFEGSTP